MRATPNSRAHNRQLDSLDCGPTCVRTVAEFFGRKISRSDLLQRPDRGRQGVSLLSLCDDAERIGLRTRPVRCTLQSLIHNPQLPFIAHWEGRHFIVVLAITRSGFLVSDPAARAVAKMSVEEFAAGWARVDGQDAAGVAVFFEPTPKFFAGDEEGVARPIMGRYLTPYLARFASELVQLALVVLCAAVLAFVVPWSMKALVDGGISSGDASTIFYVLGLQFAVLVFLEGTELLRRWMLTHISARVHVSMISDFFAQLLRLPMTFFESRTLGDVMGRIEDHRRVEQFVTSQMIEASISASTLVVYMLVLALFSPLVALVLVTAIAFQAAWFLFFTRQRAVLDFRRFRQDAEARGLEVRILGNIQEVKVTNSEVRRRSAWERAQFALYRTALDVLKIEQLQQGGARLIGHMGAVSALTLAALASVRGELSLGAMLATILIVGQVSAPIGRLMDFTRRLQDTRLSLERIGSVAEEKEEDHAVSVPVAAPQGGAIELQNVSFSYSDLAAHKTLAEISLVIPEGQVTAIVGRSGSGKSSLLKLLLKLYEPQSGHILVAGRSLANMSARDWRAQCGVVLQDGELFSDTIRANIVLDEETFDRARMLESARLACALEFIEQTPLGFETQIGGDGLAISTGQRQRLMIARALYRRPGFLFLDEATSALDTENEAAIVQSLNALSPRPTQVIIAHRLSTVRRADQIIVLENGRVAETGRHDDLILRDGIYRRLVDGQLSERAGAAA